MRRTPPLIVGGGPAGAAAAIALAHAGVSPLLLERSNGPHDMVCGAFLGWDALAGLKALGIDVAALGGRSITHVRIVAGRVLVERRLPRAAAAISRRALDAALLERAAALGAGIERGVTARRREGRALHLADGAALEPSALFLATGKHDLRGTPRIGGAARSVGLRATLPGQPDLAGWIELHLLDGGYAGLLLQEDGRSNLCLSIATARIGAAGSPEALLPDLLAEAPALASRIDGAPLAWSAVAGVPYGWRATEGEAGLFRLGDQAAVIASLAGDGIAIALAGGRAAASAWLRDGDAAAPAFQRAFAARARRPIVIAERLRHLAEAPPLARALLRGPARLPGALQLAALLTRIGA